MLDKIEHVGIQVTDLARSIDFYTNVLQMELVDSKDLDHVKIGFLQIGESQLELLQFANADDANDAGVVHHLAFTVSGIDEIVANLKTKDVQLLDQEPKAIFDGAAKVCFLKGPDGETLELWENQ